jgi:uncharacterized membrane protein
MDSRQRLLQEGKVEKTSIGMHENIVSLLCYMGAWVTGIIFLLIEPANRTVRFHASQSVIVFSILNIAYFIFWFVPVFGWILNTLVVAATFIFGVVSAIKAFQGQKWKIPAISALAQRWADK